MAGLRPSGRVSFLSFGMLVIVVAIYAAVNAGRAAAAADHTVTVRVTITAVDAIDCFDQTLGFGCGSADFYPLVTIDGTEQGSDGLQVEDNNNPRPTNWVFTQPAQLSEGKVPVKIQIFDSDGAFRFGDDQASISPNGTDVNLGVNLAPCMLTGDVTLDCANGGSLTETKDIQTQGASGDRARITFKVAVLDSDTDNDGLLDGWETRGLDTNGDGVVDVDLPALGANPQRKDLFLEVDCLVAADHNQCPQKAAIGDVVQAFANAPVGNPDGTAGIQLHVDTGPLFGANQVFPVAGGGGVAGSYGDLGGGGDQIPLTGNEIVDWDGATGNPGTSFYSIKQMDPNRAYAFRYAIFVSQTNLRAAKNDCTSGWTEGIPANDLMVSLGGTNAAGGACWGTDAAGFSVGTRAEQAGTLMHEFGHALGLQHGGNNGTNNKPNYLSVMNYSFQACGVPASPTKPTAIPGACDYSRVALPSLEERRNPLATPPLPGLDECGGIDGGAYGFGPVDWNGDGILEGATCPSPNTTNVSVDINGDGNCVGPGANGTLDTAATGDDVVVGTEVTAGPNFSCDTTATGDDSQDNSGAELEPLNSFDDWSNIVYTFQTQANFAGGVSNPETDEADPTIIANARKAMSALLAPDLTVDKSGAANATPGDTVTYTLAVANSGHGPAESVRLADTKPDGTTASFDLGFLALGSSTTRTVDYSIPCSTKDGTVVTDSASVSGNDLLGEPETATGNNTDSQTTTVHAPVLTLTKTATPTVNAGEAITFRLVYANVGSGDAKSVTVTDTLPADVYYSSALDLGTGPAPTSVTRNANGTTTLTWTVGAVAGSSGQQAIVFTARPSLLFLGGSVVTNSASLTFTNGNGCSYDAVTASGQTAITTITPTADPLSKGYWTTHSAAWTAELRARIQATDQRFDGADGSAPSGALDASEVAAVFASGGNMDAVLEEQLLAVYFDLATRRINAGTRVASKTDARLGFTNVRDAVLYGEATLALPVTSATRDRYSDAATALDEIANNKSEVYP